MKPLIRGIALAVALSTLTFGCRKAENPWAKVPGGPTRILVTIPPLYCFTKAVSGDDAAVLCLLGEQGPHGYDGSAADSLKAREADLFLYIGMDIDDFARKVVNASGNHKVELIEVGEAIPKKMLLKSDPHGHDHEGHGHDHHHHGVHDPHVWLGVPQSIKMVEFIRDKLQSVNPAKKDAFAKRAADYIKELQGLEKHAEKALAGKKNRKFIATHDALRYFAAGFKVDVLDSIQPRPGMEAEAAKFAKLVKLCEKESVRVIAVEPQYPKTAAEALVAELKRKGVTMKLADVDPMETVPPGELQPSYYLKRMRENIDNLAKALP